MEKFIVKQRVVYYQYVVVEANSKKEAMRHGHDHGDEIYFEESGQYNNIGAKPFNTGDLVYIEQLYFNVVTPRNLCHAVRKFFQRFGRKPKYKVIDESKIKPLNKIFNYIK